MNTKYGNIIEAKKDVLSICSFEKPGAKKLTISVINISHKIVVLMSIINKSLTFIVILFMQISFAQDIYEIDDYNGQTIMVCEGVFEDSNNGVLGPNGSNNYYDTNESYSITI